VFENTFAAELATRIGSSVEVFTDNGMTEGILSNVTQNLVLVIEITTGYANERVYVSVDAINFARFPATAA